MEKLARAMTMGAMVLGAIVMAGCGEKEEAAAPAPQPHAEAPATEAPRPPRAQRPAMPTTEELCSNAKFQTRKSVIGRSIVLDVPVPIPAEVLSDLREISDLTCLTSLSLALRKDISDLTPIAGLVELRELNLGYTAVTDLSPLSTLTKLERLDLVSSAVTDLTHIAGLTALRRINLGSTGVTGLGPLGGCKELEEIVLSSTKVADLGPIMDAPKLKTVQVGSHNSVPDAQLSELADRGVRIIR